MRKLVQSPGFRRAYGKFHPNEQKVIKKLVAEIVEAPGKGDPKKGSLSGTYTRSFKLHGAQFRIAYRFDEETIEFARVGPRENFYG